jgi:hypothetical protein
MTLPPLLPFFRCVRVFRLALLLEVSPADETADALCSPLPDEEDAEEVEEEEEEEEDEVAMQWLCGEPSLVCTAVVAVGVALVPLLLWLLLLLLLGRQDALERVCIAEEEVELDTVEPTALPLRRPRESRRSLLLARFPSLQDEDVREQEEEGGGRRRTTSPCTMTPDNPK